MITATRNGRARARRPEDATPPHDADAERSVVGSILIDPAALPRLQVTLRPDDFYLPPCRRVYEETLAMFRQGVPIDTLLLVGRLKDAGADAIVSNSDLAEMVKSVPTVSQIAWYARIVALKAQQRRAWEIGYRLIQLGLDDCRAGHDYAGWRSEIEAFSGLVFHETEDDRQAAPQIITAAELMRREYPRQKWVVPGVLIEGLSLLAGKPKFGKSWLTLSLAIGVATGGKALGKIDVTAGDVLYLALDDDDRRLQKRLGILLGGEAAPERLYRATQWKRSNEGGLDDLRVWLADHPEARLVIIDTLRRFKPRGSTRANAYDSDYEAMMPLQFLAAEFGVCILVVHHTNRGKKEDILDSVNGSNGLASGADSILVAQKERGRSDGLLFLTGRDVEEKTLALTFDAQTCAWLLGGEVDAERAAMRPERRAIVDILTRRAPYRPGPAEVALALGKMGKQERNSVRALMLKMEKEGQIVNDGTGHYAVADS
ncbi:MAG TPA: AAA family ATPase [Pirellulales bacterium]|jgi:hypothetical protein|nr:AAA family ATPase [Pirellulales bacterium]